MKTSDIILSLVVAVLLLSCNTSKRSFKSVKSSVDSSASMTRDSVVVARQDSAGTKKAEGGYERETIIYFDTADAYIDTLPVNAMQTVEFPVRQAFYRSIRRIEVREKGNFKTEETAHKINTDSTGAHVQAHVEVKKSEAVIVKQKEKSKFPTMRVIIGVIALVVIFLVAKKIKII